MKNVILYNTSEDEWSCADEAIEEIAQQALDEMSEEEFLELGYVTIYKGVSKKQEFAPFFSADSLLESIHDRAYDECGDIAEDYLQIIPQEVVEDLEIAVCRWAKMHNLEPTWSMVEDIVEIKIYPADKKDIDNGFRVEVEYR